jgi:hypothetical protein
MFIPIVEACTIIGVYMNLILFFLLLASLYNMIDTWLQKSLLASTGRAAHSVVVI